MPLDATKNFEGVPLIRTAKFADVRQPIIQFTANRGTPNLDKNESNVGPINTVKILHQVQFEDESTSVFGFHRMECLLDDTDRFNNLAVF